jgi:hypothetical protein
MIPFDPLQPGALIKLERVIIDAPLGLRFWDSITHKVIGDGLVVTVYPMQKPSLRSQAEPNRSGVYTFHRLPLLGTVEIKEGTGPIWTAPGADKGFILEVFDRLGRFQPFQTPITELPRGVFAWACPTLSPLSPAPPAGEPSIGLFSSAARSVPPGCAVVRASLRQVSADPRGKPAAWAVLSVFYRGKLLERGLADKDGAVVVIFPYPQPPISSSASGLLGAPIPLTRQVWEVNLSAQFAPLDPAPDFPNLCDVLSAPQVSLVEQLSPVVPFDQALVHFGQETVVRTTGFSQLFFTNP